MFRRKRYSWPGHATVPEAVRYLASACDGAVRRDGHGFGAQHVAVGHWLAGLPDQSWHQRELSVGRDLVRIYRRQLQRAGFDGHAILKGARPRRVRLSAVKGLSPGWHPDPTGIHAWRWWNGVRWTALTGPEHK